MKKVWTGQLAQFAARYGEHGPTAAVCCNACRTCITTNVAGLLTGSVAAAAVAVRRFARRFFAKS